MRRQRRTKIVATLGPASSDQAIIERMFVAGADVFRINMSHTPHEAMRGYVRMIRAVEQKYERPIAILVDLQGPKLRLDTFAGGGATIVEGATFILDDEKKPGDESRVHLPHPEVLAALDEGHRLLVDDGKIKLRVIEASAKRVVTKVEVGGRISDRGDWFKDKLILLP
jgi:pyruvate kinase